MLDGLLLVFLGSILGSCWVVQKYLIAPIEERIASVWKALYEIEQAIKKPSEDQIPYDISYGPDEEPKKPVDPFRDAKEQADLQEDLEAEYHSWDHLDRLQERAYQKQRMGP